MQDRRSKCAHRACLCLVAEGQDWCSGECEEAQGQDGDAAVCECGHADCDRSIGLDAFAPA
ncbi:MAG: hypothetical protein EOP90_04340 [Lysobacteraceae bacterium]|nr:MAG: hypothetical protein EOP90_04340 [Xanthomonadaceae bacterium]